MRRRQQGGNRPSDEETTHADVGECMRVRGRRPNKAAGFGEMKKTGPRRILSWFALWRSSSPESASVRGREAGQDMRIGVSTENGGEVDHN